MNLNVRPAIRITQALLPGMRKAGQGRIVAISSRAALGKELRTSYAASKSALHGLMKTWALELARDGITANAIGPGSIETPLWPAANDRKSVVEGKSVSVRVDPGGPRFIKKKTHINSQP